MENEDNIEEPEIIMNFNVDNPLHPSHVFNSSKPRLHLLDGTFYKYLPGESNAITAVALCMKCPVNQQTKVKGFYHSTSNFLSHLKRKHGEDCVEDYKKYMKLKKTEITNLGESSKTSKIISTKQNLIDSISQERFEENIVKYFIHSMIPLRTVEDPYFSKIFSDLQVSNLGLKIISRRSLSRRIHSYYENEILKVKSDLEDIEYVCTVIDVWSTKKRSFLGMTVHWINSGLRRESAALACQRLNGPHSYDRLSEAIQVINTEFNLDSKKIVASVTDNASNFIKAFKEFGVQLSNIETIETTNDSSENEESQVHPESLELNSGICFSDIEDENSSATNVVNSDDANISESLPAHLRCCAHTLSVCATSHANKILNAKDTLLSNKHCSIMKKCNALWKAAGRPRTAEIMHEILQHTLSRPGETRWNSLFDALQQIWNIKEKNLQLHKALNIKNAFVDSDFDYIKEYLICSTPITEALDIMQSEVNTFYGIVLPCLLALKKNLKKVEKKNNFIYCKPLIESYKQSVNSRFKMFFNMNTVESENAAIAALSYPRFKNKWLTCLDPADEDKVIKVFKTVISKQIYEKPKEAINMTKNDKKESKFFNFDSDSDSDSSLTHVKKTHVPLTKAELLMLHFFAEESQELDILNKYPEIKQVFIKYNTPLPSSAAVERLFSYATMINLPKSHKLSDNMFEKRVVLKCNLNYSKK